MKMNVSINKFGGMEKKTNLKYMGTHTIGVPEDLIFAGKHLSHGEVRLWIAIRSHCGRKDEHSYTRCWPGRERLAMMIGISKTQTSSLIGKLKQKNLLRTRHRGLGKPNDYFLYDPPKNWASETWRKINRAKEQRLSEKKKSYSYIPGKP
jgi:hypothetical protein